jgi:hypothetical protein
MTKKGYKMSLIECEKHSYRRRKWQENPENYEKFINATHSTEALDKHLEITRSSEYRNNRTGDKNPNYKRVARLCDNPDCWNLVYVRPSHLLKFKHNFCSFKCSVKWQHGDNNPLRRPDTYVKACIAMNTDECKEKRYAFSHTPEFIASHSGENSVMKREDVRKKHRDAHNTPEHLANHPMKRPEVLEKHKKAHNTPEYIANHNMKRPEVVAKISGKNSNFYGKPPYQNPGYAKGQWFTHPDGREIWLRSSYEVRIATLFTKTNIIWDYESKTFPMVINGKDATYHPDFYLFEYNCWIDSKGWLRPESKEKIEKFYSEYKDENLLILYEEDIDSLEQLLQSEPNSLGQWLTATGCGI